ARIKKQCKLAEEFYNAQPDDVKEKISDENATLHSSRVAAFKKLVSGSGFSLEGIDELTDAEKQLCRADLLTFIQPLLDAIRAHTGLWLTLLAGAPPQNAQDPNSDFAVLAISSRTAQGLKFQEWKPKEFDSKVMNLFLLFLHADTDMPKAADDLAQSKKDILNNPLLITISEPGPSTERAKKNAVRNAKKSTNNDDEDDEEDNDDEEYGDDEEEEEGDKEEDDNEEEEEEEEEEDPYFGLHPNRRKKLLPESRKYLDSLSPEQRRIEIAPLFCHYSAYEFQRENNILRTKWYMLQITNGRKATDIILNGPDSPQDSLKDLPTHTSQSPSCARSPEAPPIGDSHSSSSPHPSQSSPHRTPPSPLLVNSEQSPSAPDA
ncbi:hypothetical protein F5878DRAFT_668090, partial [Lentinula raphanica]